MTVPTEARVRNHSEFQALVTDRLRSQQDVRLAASPVDGGGYTPSEAAEVLAAAARAVSACRAQGPRDAEPARVVRVAIEVEVALGRPT